MLSRQVFRAGRARTLLLPLLSSHVSLQRPASKPRHIRAYAIIPIVVGPMADSLNDGTLKRWAKGVGDQVEANEEVNSVETDKVDFSVQVPATGVITKILEEEGATVTVGQHVGLLDTEGSGESAPATDQAGKPADKVQSEPPSDQEKVDRKPQHPATSSAPPAPAEKPAEKPVEKPVEKRADTEQQSKRESGAGSTAPGRGERRQKMNRMRLRIAERLKQSQNVAASLTTFNEVDMTSLMELRKLYRDDVLKQSGVKLGFMGAFAHACVLAMRDLPIVNASMEGPGGGDTIVFHDYIDISVAVATEKGLVTPVVRNAEVLGILGIEKAIAELGKKARDSKLTIEDMAGGTFTISNGGVFGSMMGTPIINQPQAAVLGLHAIKERAVAVAGRVEIRPMMNLALTYDHRVMDGREAVQFLVKVKEYIEDPRRMLLHLA